MEEGVVAVLLVTTIMLATNTYFFFVSLAYVEKTHWVKELWHSSSSQRS
jgi:hypothetical protein